MSLQIHFFNALSFTILMYVIEGWCFSKLFDGNLNEQTGRSGCCIPCRWTIRSVLQQSCGGLGSIVWAGTEGGNGGGNVRLQET